ncbi:hypothetical protein like AT2G26530 [Hibiscus trionum]|uniref:Uncharacterized protein n=1 Tax=Hibiscus trionum TaxID=183268 RepID=A0A9W7LXE6_HIBTR|nr:hypothetical protein like AT2G26530 [Hibiscus trionum]
MEVVISSSPVMDFDFNSARSSPVSTAPSTPRRFGDCSISAPSSPARLFEFYREFDRYDLDTPKSPGSTTRNHVADEVDDFAFDFSVDLEKTSRSAEELFDGGKIKPLKPPPRLRVDEYDQKSPLLSPGKQKVDRENGRGRERVQDFTLRNSSRRATRSVSPSRWEDEEEERAQQREPTTGTKQSSLNSKPSFSSTSSKSSSRKWRLRDLLLFRSASEGRASDKDPLRKYSASSFKKPEENKNPGGSRRKVSAHELHYTTNKAVSENMKKKTFLPYKQGILGRLAFNPLSNGFGK